MNPYSPEMCLLKKRPKFQLALNANKIEKWRYLLFVCAFVIEHILLL